MRARRWTDWVTRSGWIPDRLSDSVFPMTCWLVGHVPGRDHCGLPQHDHCLRCGRPMPGKAPRPA